MKRHTYTNLMPLQLPNDDTATYITYIIDSLMTGSILPAACAASSVVYSSIGLDYSLYTMR